MTLRELCVLLLLFFFYCFEYFQAGNNPEIPSALLTVIKQVIKYKTSQ